MRIQLCYVWTQGCMWPDGQVLCRSRMLFNGCDPGTLAFCPKATLIVLFYHFLRLKVPHCGEVSFEFRFSVLYYHMIFFAKEATHVKSHFMAQNSISFSMTFNLLSVLRNPHASTWICNCNFLAVRDEINMILCMRIISASDAKDHFELKNFD